MKLIKLVLSKIGFFPLKAGDNAIYFNKRVVTIVSFDGLGSVWVNESGKEQHCVNLKNLNKIF